MDKLEERLYDQTFQFNSVLENSTSFNAPTNYIKTKGKQLNVLCIEYVRTL